MKLLSSLSKRLGTVVIPLLGVLSIAGAIETLVVHGFLLVLPPGYRLIERNAFVVLFAVYFLWVALQLVHSGWRFRAHLHDLVLIVLFFAVSLPSFYVGSIISFRMLIYFGGLLFKRAGLTAFISQARITPARILLVSFAAVISIGVVLLMLPAATADSLGAGFIDALFTATSATCVTGLIVRDTGSYFSFFGQLVILVLIQIGGLGIMTLSTLFLIMLGRRLGFRQEEQMRDILDQSSATAMYTLLVKIIGITVVFEAAGALLLFLRFQHVHGITHALKSSIFHSISSFCNAGFSLYPDSLTSFVSDWYVNGVVIILIVFGGLGFVVIDDMIKVLASGTGFSGRWRRLTVHSRLVLIMTFVLTAIGTMAVFFYEFDNTLLDLPIADKLLASLFQSVTFRTAGFNTIDTAGLAEITLFFGMLLMFIGASPASTGGGIKTTTFAVLLLSVRCLLRSRDEAELFGRTIHHQTVYKSIAILLFSFTFIVVSSMLLLSTQDSGFIDIMFESVSAIGTVGLSTGVTQALDGKGKLILTVLMYIGRVGPLTVALALGDVKKVNVEYPKARITVG